MINLATEADQEAVVRLLLTQLHEQGITAQTAELTAAIEGVPQHPERGVLFVAKVAGAPVGVAYLAFTWTLEHGGKAAWLEEMYVVPEHRGKGIGRKLLKALCDYAMAQGCAAVDLEVGSAQQRATHLYAREGFRPLHRTRWALVLR